MWKVYKGKKFAKQYSAHCTESTSEVGMPSLKMTVDCAKLLFERVLPSPHNGESKRKRGANAAAKRAWSGGGNLLHSNGLRELFGLACHGKMGEGRHFPFP